MPKHNAFLCVFFIVLTSQFRASNSANILCMFTSSGISKLSVFVAVANTLIERDHNVTIVTTIPIPQQMQSKKPFRHVQLDQRNARTPMLAKETNCTIAQVLARLNYLRHALMFPSVQRDDLEQIKFKDFLKEDNHFDLMLLGYFNNDFVVGVAGRYRCPIAVISLGAPYGPINRIIGNPEETSYVPFPLFGRQQPMGFSERLMNFAWAVLEPFVQMLVHHIMEYHYKSLFTDDMFPKYSDVMTNVSLVLCNSHFSEMPVRPLVPALVEIGGIQVKDQPDPLPEDIQAFLDTSPNGTILFQIGTKYRGTFLNPHELTIVLNVLSKLEQNVLWEWDYAEAPPKYSNILFKRSLPIEDIFFHPNLKLYVTDGRPYVTFTASVRGIPMLGIPLYADEPYYIEDMTNRDFGVSLDISFLTEELLQDALKKVIENPFYNRKVKSFSKFYRDRPLTARESAAFWLEYVIRHRGARHMQSPLVHMDLLQQWNVDVILALCGILYAFEKLTKLTVSFVRIFFD